MRLIIVFLCVVQLSTATITSGVSLRFYEEPTDVYLVKNVPITLKCKIENARTGFFRCNDQWIQEDLISSKTIQVGNKQILTMEIDITREQLEENRKVNDNDFWCVCQGWSYNGDTLLSRKASVKQAYIGQSFVWEPMTTSGVLGKSVEIRCLPPAGVPKPIISWLKNNEVMDLDGNKRILISNEGSLLVNDVRASDNGNYTCVAENIAGRRVSDMAPLIVEENRGWTEWSNWTECGSLSMINCGEGIKKRYRKCLNPPTINNALGCDGFPMQILTCYSPCSTTESTTPTYKWSEWTEWQIECENAEDEATCRKLRKRFCIGAGGEASKCPGNSIETINCSPKTPCFGNSRKTDSTKSTNSIDSIFTDSNPHTYFMPVFVAAIIFLIVFFVFVLVVLIRQKCCISINKMKTKQFPQSPSSSIDDHNPIYYSVQPDPYMDMCTLLQTSKYTNSTCLTNTNTNTSCNSSTTDCAIDLPPHPRQQQTSVCSMEPPQPPTTFTLIKFIQNKNDYVQQQQQYENLDLL